MQSKGFMSLQIPISLHQGASMGVPSLEVLVPPENFRNANSWAPPELLNLILQGWNLVTVLQSLCWIQYYQISFPKDTDFSLSLYSPNLCTYRVNGDRFSSPLVEGFPSMILPQSTFPSSSSVTFCPHKML